MNDNSINIPLFNFLDTKLTPTATCHSPATDNYEVENLISNDITKKNLGYLAYSALKPPVEIEFKFICPVNIYYVMVKTTVGSQKSTGIEIMAKNDSQDYTYISKSIHKQSGVYFCNSKIYSVDKYPKNYNPNLFNLAYFNKSSYKVFLEATSLKLKIFQTERSVPCIGAIEVWGIPAKCCSEVTKKTINHIMLKKNQTFCSTPIITNEQFCIPEDFKDDLTYELMSIPYTLPSGKTIDQSTLDKHLKIENQFGRKPCDPFTGIKFSDTMKPILNMALKSRIDMFMLQNYSRPEFNNCKRILGRSSHSNSESINKRARTSSTFDLEDAIANIKESPKFINISTNNINVSSCVKCLKQYCFLYKIGCEHYYCRQCLVLALKDSNCSSCQKTFCTKDIERVNL